MFVGGSTGWMVRTLADEDAPVYVVWALGGVLVGVASDQDGLESLFDDVIRDYTERKLGVGKAYKILGVRKERNEKVQAQGFVAELVANKNPKAGAKFRVVIKKAGSKLVKTIHRNPRPKVNH